MQKYTDLYTSAPTYTTSTPTYTQVHRLIRKCTDLYASAQTYTQVHRLIHKCTDLYTGALTYTYNLTCTSTLTYAQVC